MMYTTQSRGRNDRRSGPLLRVALRLRCIVSDLWVRTGFVRHNAAVEAILYRQALRLLHEVLNLG
jgi:hypothetical protein